ncbi:MAG: proton-conducting transporter membrane subunit, partial [Bacteroidota bacterium]
QIWVPATYQEAPIDAVAIMSIVPKLAGIVLLKRLLLSPQLADSHWIIQVVLLLGIATVIIGTAGALRQSNTRRMISFGAIAHSGFLLPFAILIGETGDQAFWWYSFAYVVMNLAAFYLLGKYEEQGITKNEEYQKGAETWGGIAFAIVLISLVGIPPLAGFTAKFFLFSSLWEVYQLSEQPIYLIYFLVVVFATVISLFFYLRIPYYAFVSGGAKQPTASIKFSLSTKIVATIFAVTLLFLFFVPKLIVTMHHLLNNIHE